MCKRRKNGGIPSAQEKRDARPFASGAGLLQANQSTYCSPIVTTVMTSVCTFTFGKVGWQVRNMPSMRQRH